MQCHSRHSSNLCCRHCMYSAPCLAMGQADPDHLLLPLKDTRSVLDDTQSDAVAGQPCHLSLDQRSNVDDNADKDCSSTSKNRVVCLPCLVAHLDVQKVRSGDGHNIAHITIPPDHLEYDHAGQSIQPGCQNTCASPICPADIAMEPPSPPS